MTQDLTPAARIEAIAAAAGLSVAVTFVPFSQSRNAKPGAKCSERSLNWRASLSVNGRPPFLETDYQQGIGHSPAYVAAKGRITLDAERAVIGETESGKRWRLGNMTGVYQTAQALPAPTVADIVSCLILDGGAIDHATFESWADEYGYDTDSRKAESIYRACLETGLKMRAALGEKVLSDLRDAAAEY